MFLRVVELSQIEQLVSITASPKSVEPDLDTVRNQHPPRTWRINGVIPGLLHRAAAATWHNGVQIACTRLLQFERSHDLVGSVGPAETTKRNID